MKTILLMLFIAVAVMAPTERIERANQTPATVSDKINVTGTSGRFYTKWFDHHSTMPVHVSIFMRDTSETGVASDSIVSQAFYQVMDSTSLGHVIFNPVAICSLDMANDAGAPIDFTIAEVDSFGDYGQQLNGTIDTLTNTGYGTTGRYISPKSGNYIRFGVAPLTGHSIADSVEYIFYPDWAQYVYTRNN